MEKVNLKILSDIHCELYVDSEFVTDIKKRHASQNSVAQRRILNYSKVNDKSSSKVRGNNGVII